MEDKMVKFCHDHIIRIENYISDLYTIECPEGYDDRRCTDDKINVYEELNYLKSIEGLYEVIEMSKNPKGHLYEEYRGWLENVRSSIEIVKKEVERIKRCM